MIDITIFSSRELALAVWTTIVLTWMCFSQNLRNSLRNLLAAFFKLKLQILFVGGYVVDSATNYVKMNDTSATNRE